MKKPVTFSMVSPEDINIGTKILGTNGIVFSVVGITKDENYYTIDIQTNRKYLSIMTVHKEDKIIIID